MDYDVKIVGGTIMDGTGNQGYRGDLGIQGGRVVALGEAKGEAGRTIDAGGLVVCPGFVDIHTHYDAQVLWDQMLTISPWHGVTTAVMGNCGFGVAPMRPADRQDIMKTLEKVEGMSYAALEAGLGLDWPFESFPEYMDVVQQGGTAINMAAFIGHTPLRIYVMGDDAMEREATGAEVEAMAQIVREAMAAGAIGFSTSQAATHNAFDGRPIPSRLASFSELDALVGAMAESGRGIMQCTIGKTLFHDEMSELARRHNVPVTWTALLAGLSGPGSHKKHLKRTAEERAEGLHIVPQVACRPIMFDFDFGEPFPFEMRPIFKETMQTDQHGKKAIYADDSFRQNFRADTDPSAKNMLAGWAQRAVISAAPSDHSLEERSLVDVAAEQGKDPIDLALDMSIDSDFAARFRVPLVNFDHEEVRELLGDDNTVVALSDAGAHASQLCDACYSTHLLGHWSRDEGAMEMEKAVHMLTQKPADLMGITDRGLLAQGRPADVVLFDPEVVGATGLTRVYDQPAGQDRLVAQAKGIQAVIVNGTVIREDNKDAVSPGEALPGQMLRGGKAV
ncbi:MAG: amidohydrolase family protein [Rhodospirillaceae bacterium]|jgi:N-acyl-D-aspartate/D-glutamate deacylase|nr:amidohydrolase family protein [Rhodospirillaceae bacterium]MBT4044455.1 amidohydrolase family protein [Rhodospirillaceae bacterium]MBT4689131.1 amidohydrolase family protein [Rhodospirillaceae bacterium]MBT5080871.1 amidohydrolase family protein [Rhodospirillaceae bacterium]MBT5525292.1 amidohydrolase family protein [Rhodospirillaceae bacterium]